MSGPLLTSCGGTLHCLEFAGCASREVFSLHCLSVLKESWCTCRTMAT